MLDSEDAVLVEKTGEGAFQVRVTTHEHSFVMDEPIATVETAPDEWKQYSTWPAAWTRRIMSCKIFRKMNRRCCRKFSSAPQTRLWRSSSMGSTRR